MMSDWEIYSTFDEVSRFNDGEIRGMCKDRRTELKRRYEQ